MIKHSIVILITMISTQSLEARPPSHTDVFLGDKAVPYGPSFIIEGYNTKGHGYLFQITKGWPDDYDVNDIGNLWGMFDKDKNNSKIRIWYSEKANKIFYASSKCSRDTLFNTPAKLLVRRLRVYEGGNMSREINPKGYLYVEKIKYKNPRVEMCFKKP